jgi:hypothetical protein
MKNKAIRYLISFTVSLFLTLNLVVACAQPKPSPPSPVPPRAQPPTATENQTPEEAPPVNEAINEKEWYTIGIFSGKGNDTTPAFHIHGTEWRITWTIDAEHPETAIFKLVIYQKDASYAIWQTVSNPGSSDGEVNYFLSPEDKRDFFIKVTAQNLRRWTIIIEDNAPGTTSSPILITYIRYKGTVYPSDPEEGICYERVEPDEYVVIKNLSECYVDMSGWVLKNITKWYPSFTFPLNFILGPGQIIRVYTDEIYPECETWREFGTKAPYYTDSEKSWLSFYYGPGDIWSNDKPDIAVLYDAQGNEISRKSYAVPTENE